MPKYDWFQTPDDLTLGHRSAWHQVGTDKKLFATGRTQILVVKNTSSEFTNGPVILPIQRGNGHEAARQRADEHDQSRALIADTFRDGERSVERRAPRRGFPPST